MANDSPNIEIAEFTKNSREAVRVGLSEFKGYKLLQLRAWAKKEDGTAIPTKSGLSVQVHLIPQLRAALDEAEKRAREIGWLKEGGPP
jgi:hypothetical protein